MDADAHRRESDVSDAEVRRFRSIFVCKAEPVVDRDPAPEDVHIVIGGRGEFPHCDNRRDADKIRDQDATAILRAFKSSLPGGTLDRLCGLMMLDRGSELIVSLDALAARRAHAGDPPPSPVVNETGEFMTWRSLHRRLDELARRDDSYAIAALDHEAVVRIDEDGLIACCGGVSWVDVEVGVGEEAALVLDGTTRLLCDDLVAFSNGQLVPVREAQFRRHLSGCSTCQDELVDQVTTMAKLSNPGYSVGLREDYRALLSSFVRLEERSSDPVRRMRGIVVGAALSAALNGPRLVVELARPLMALHQQWTREPGSPVYSDSLDALMDCLGLAVDDFWERRHAPVLSNTDDFPGVQIVGCSCDWMVQAGETNRAQAFEMHAAGSWDDELDAEIEAAQAGGDADGGVAAQGRTS